MTAPTVVLIGPMGAGKTSVGRKAARLLGVPFCDTDAVIAREHGPIPTIFATRGEAHFRRLEREAVGRALRAGGVVALGGGAILDEGTRADLAGCDVVLLTVDRRTVASRLRATTRPLLAGQDPMARWDAVAAERRELYAAVADVVVDTSRGPIRSIAERVADWTRKRWDASADTDTQEEER